MNYKLKNFDASGLFDAAKHYSRNLGHAQEKKKQDEAYNGRLDCMPIVF